MTKKPQLPQKGTFQAEILRILAADFDGAISLQKEPVHTYLFNKYGQRVGKHASSTRTALTQLAESGCIELEQDRVKMTRQVNGKPVETSYTSITGVMLLVEPPDGSLTSKPHRDHHKEHPTGVERSEPTLQELFAGIEATGQVDLGLLAQTVGAYMFSESLRVLSGEADPEEVTRLTNDLTAALAARDQAEAHAQAEELAARAAASEASELRKKVNRLEHTVGEKQSTIEKINRERAQAQRDRDAAQGEVAALQLKVRRHAADLDRGTQAMEAAAAKIADLEMMLARAEEAVRRVKFTPAALDAANTAMFAKILKKAGRTDEAAAEFIDKLASALESDSGEQVIS